MPTDDQAPLLSRPDLAGSCYRARNQALESCQLPALEWDNLDEVEQDAWLGMVEEAILAIENAEQQRWSTVAANAYLAYERRRYNTPLDFFTLPLGVQVAWEAAIRHLYNLLDGFDPNDPDEGGKLAEHEEYWRSWAPEKVRQLHLPEYQARLHQPTED
jgi:hypothetical protein